MMTYSPLPDSIRSALTLIEPTRDGDMTFVPCRATLKDGRVFDTVCIMAEKDYAWHSVVEENEGNGFLRMEDVAHIEPSPTRLPAQYANQLYREGESGMGYFLFTIVYNDGSREVYVTGGAVDFIPYPDGKSADDIAQVLRSEGRDALSVAHLPKRYWCFYAE